MQEGKRYESEARSGGESNIETEARESTASRIELYLGTAVVPCSPVISTEGPLPM